MHQGKPYQYWQRINVAAQCKLWTLAAAYSAQNPCGGHWVREGDLELLQLAPEPE